MVIRLRAGRRIRFPVGQATASTQAVGPTEPSIKWTGEWSGRGCQSDHSPPSSVEVNNAWSYTSTPPYVFMTWCLVKHKNNFMFHLYLCFIAHAFVTIRDPFSDLGYSWYDWLQIRAILWSIWPSLTMVLSFRRVFGRSLVRISSGLAEVLTQWMFMFFGSLYRRMPWCRLRPSPSKSLPTQHCWLPSHHIQCYITCKVESESLNNSRINE
jgi:hypothetical protein